MFFSRHIRNQTLTDGRTGTVAFDENGDRINAEYEIINIQYSSSNEIFGKEHVNVGGFQFNKVSLFF